MLREASFREKADELDDLLQDDDPLFDRIEVGDLEGGVTGEADKLNGIITLDPRVIPRRRVLRRYEPELVELAGTLLHEAIHLQCRDELAAWGNEIALYRLLRRNLGDLFEDCDEAARRSISRLLDDLIRETEATRRRIARRGGAGYGGGSGADRRLPEPEHMDKEKGKDDKGSKKFFIAEKYPAEPRSAEEKELFSLGDAIWSYWKKTEKFPPAPNAEMVKALRELGIRHFRAEDLNLKGELLDAWDNPYVYRTPGKIFRDFELYSLGPKGEDEDGEGDNILYITRRR